MWKLSCVRVLSIVALMLTLASGAGAEPTLRLSHVHPPESVVDKDLQALGAEVEREAGITLQRFPNSALGEDTDVERLVGIGSVDMALQPASPLRDKRFDIGALPFFAEDWADARKKFGASGGVRKAIEDLYAQQGIKVLAAYPMFFGGIVLQPNPMFAGKREFRVRVPKGRAYLAESLGYTAVELSWSETRRQFERGMIDGVAGSGAEACYASFLPGAQYYLVANTHFEVWYLLINARRFDALSKGQRDSLQRASGYFEAQRWSKAEAAQSFSELRLRNAGVSIIRPTRQEAERTAAEVRRKVWPTIFESIGWPYAEKLVTVPRCINPSKPGEVNTAGPFDPWCDPMGNLPGVPQK